MKIEKLEKFIRITAENNMFLTEFKEGDDILTFTSSKIIYAPLTAEFPNLIEISEETNNILTEQQISMIKEKENE